MAQVETSWHTIKNHLGKFYQLWRFLFSYLNQGKKSPTNTGEKRKLVDGRFQRKICLEMGFYGSGEFDWGRAAVWEESGSSAHTARNGTHVNTILSNTYFSEGSGITIHCWMQSGKLNPDCLGSLDFLNKRARFWDLSYKSSSGLRVLFLPCG